MLIALAAGLAARVEEAAPPLIDLDGTFFVQLGLFLLTLFVLSRSLFGPYLKMRSDREHSIAGARKQATAMGEKARGIVEDYEKQLGEAKRRGNEERNKLHQEGVARERELLGKARAEAQSALDLARKKIVTDTAAGKSLLVTEASQLARKVASKALGREIA